MMMQLNCEKCQTILTGQLGCFGHCDLITIPLTVEKLDIYYVQWVWLGSINKKEVALNAGEQFKIKGEWFNEYSDLTLTFWDSEGNQLVLERPDPLTTLCQRFEEFEISFRPSFSRVEKYDPSTLITAKENNCLII